MRKLGIDYGDTRIGIALSDPLGIIASGLETYKSQGFKKDALYIKRLVDNNNVDTIVLGLPLNMDGSRGPRCEITESFADFLKETINVNIEFIDERLTTVESEKLLIEAGKSREKRKEVIDKVSAVIILQNYLNRKF